MKPYQIDVVLLAGLKSLETDMAVWLSQFRQSPQNENERDRPSLEVKKEYERDFGDGIGELDALSLSGSVIHTDCVVPELRIRDLPLGPGIRYHSATKDKKAQSIGGWKFPEAKGRGARVSIRNPNLPQTVVTGLKGQHISVLIAHPLLIHPDLIIEKVEFGTDGTIETLDITLPDVLIHTMVPA